MMNPLVPLVLAPVKFYQKYVSPLTSPRSRYYPSCSQYFVEAVQTHGVGKGFLLGVARVLRCNPWSRGGVDHVPEKGPWKAAEWVPPDDWAGHDIEEGP